MAHSNAYIYLASRSPRRRELLAQIGVPFEVLAVEVDESVHEKEAPRDYVMRLARQKAEAGWLRVTREARPACPVLGADTTVALGERILGTPADRKEAAAMLAALSGRSHEVLTAVVLKLQSRLESALSVSEVRFKPLTPAEIERYVASGECDDKAGAYGIQGRAAAFVAELRGSYSGVAGLPLFETALLLDRLGDGVASSGAPRE